MTERIPHIYSYQSAGNTGRPVHPMCAAMSNTQLKYVTLTHDGSNATFSFHDWEQGDMWSEPAAVESAPISPEPTQRSIRLGDSVLVLIGPDRGKTGIVDRFCSTGGVTVSISGRVPDVTYWPEELRIASAQAHGLTTPATPSAAVGASEPGDKPFRLEYGKRYVRADRNVSDPMERTAPESQKGITHPFRCPKYDVTYDEDGSHVAGEQCPCNLVAEYHEPSQPAESPDDWVMITDPEHIVRACDLVSCDGVLWRAPNDSLGNPISYYSALLFRCRRKDLPVVPAEQTTETPALPKFPEGVERNTVQWGQAAAWKAICKWCCENGMPLNRDLNGIETVAQWILDLKAAAKPTAPNATPAEKPRMRQVTLRELRGGQEQTVWTTNTIVPESSLTGRTAVVEVPE